MDPEIQQLREQLEEAQRHLLEITNSNTASSAAVKNAIDNYQLTLDKLNKAQRDNTTTVQSSTSANTKYSEAALKVAKANAEAEEQINRLGKALETASGVIGGAAQGVAKTLMAFGYAAVSGKEGLTKYSEAIDSAASMVSQVTAKMGLLGVGIDILVQNATKQAKDALELGDNMTALQREVVKTAGALPVTRTEFTKLAIQAGFAGASMEKFQKAMQSAGVGLVGLGVNAGQGAAKFAEVVDVNEDIRQRFGRLGVSFDQLAEYQAKYIQQQTISGNALQMQAKSAAQVRQESLAYAENLIKLTGLTGKSAEQLEQERDKVRLAAEEQLAILAENAKIDRLKKEGSPEALAEARRLESERDLRQKTGTVLANLTSEEVAIRASMVARTGSMAKAPELAQLGFSTEEIQSLMRQGEQGAAKFADLYKQRAGGMAERLGVSREFLSPEQRAMLGIGDEKAIQTLNTMQGKSLSEKLKIVEDQIGKAGQAGRDTFADEAEKLASEERIKTAQYNERLLNLLEQGMPKLTKTLENFESIAKTAAIALAALGAATTAATIALGARGLFGGLGGAGAAGAGSGLLRSGLGLLGKAGLVGMGITGAIGAYQGYNADPKASFGGKLLNAGSSALNMLSFGLLGSSSDQIANTAVANADPGSIAKLQEAQIDRAKENTTVIQNQSDIGKTLSKTFTDFNTIMLSTNKQMKDFNESLESINQSLGGGAGGGAGGAFSGGGAGGGNGIGAGGAGLVSQLQQLTGVLGTMLGGGGGEGNSPPGPDSKLLDFIGKLESGNNYNMLVGGRVKSDIPLTAMTVREVLEFQRTMKARGHESTALGKYQIIRSTLQGIVNAGILKLDDRFDQTNQDKAAAYLLDLRGRQAYKTGKISADQYANNLAQEWAGLPMPNGKSYYAGVGSNKSHVSRGEFISALQAREGGIFSGPESGYPIELHGTEMILPLGSGTIRGNKVQDILSSLTTVGEKQNGIGKNKRIHDVLLQIVNNETTKAIQAVNEANSPMKNISNEISNSMRQIMEAHNHTMNELTYKLGDMINALNTSNDVTKKILKKASA